MTLAIFFIVFSPFLAIAAGLWAGYDVLRAGCLRQFRSFGSWPKGLFLLCLWSLLSAAVNSHFLSALAACGLGAYALLAVYVQHRFRTAAGVESLLTLTFQLTVVSAVIGLLQKSKLIGTDPAGWKYFFGLITVVFNQDTVGRITGTFGNSNLAAVWFAVFCLVGYYLAERSPGRGKIFLLAGTALCLMALLLTESRGAMGGLYLGLMVYEFLDREHKPLWRRLFLPMGGFILFLAFLACLAWGDLDFPTFQLRWAIWSNCWYLFLAKPLAGWGLLGIYFLDSNAYQYLRVLHAHNFLLSILTMLGLVGLAIFAWMEWSLWGDLRRLLQEKNRLLPLLSGIHAVFIGAGLFDFPVMGMQAGILFFASAALAGGLVMAGSPKPTD